MLKRSNIKNGFTLIELLVVVLIIGILAAVAVPQYQKAIEKTRAAEVYTLLSSLYRAQKAYYLSSGQWAKDFSELPIEFPYTDPGASSHRFVGGDFVWSKCGNYDCAYAAKKYKSGYWFLQVNYKGDNEGDIICGADSAKNAHGLCQSLGFSKTSIHQQDIAFDGTGGIGTVNFKYYRKN